ncbi:MAG: hypothetical protein ACI84K_000877 [Pseudohongiellaceae bacterium]|jgi:hypothetical protein
MLEHNETLAQKLKGPSAMLLVLLIAFINLTACGGSNGDDAFREAVKVNDLNITAIKIERENDIVEIGVTETYRAMATIGAGPETKNITNIVRWSSSNTSVVSINSSGVATTLSEGMVTIRAEIADLYASEDLISSAAVLQSIDIERDEIPATVGVCTHGHQMVAHGNYGVEPEPRIITKIVDWVSDDPTIATVTDEGEVATLKGGAVTFTASREVEGVSVPVLGTTNLTVDRDLLTSIAVTPDTGVNIFIGSSQQFKAMGTYSNLDEPTDITTTADWLASNNDGGTTGEHLEISAGGLAKGVSAGNSDVTASCAGDPDAIPDAIDPAAISSAVNVTIEVSVTLTDIEINGGDEFENVELADLNLQLRATLVYSNGSSTTDVTDDSDTIWTVKSGTATLSELASEKGEVFFAETGTSVISVFYTDANDKKVSNEISIIVN